jgi:hypothetical protein
VKIFINNGIEKDTHIYRWAGRSGRETREIFFALVVLDVVVL